MLTITCILIAIVIGLPRVIAYHLISTDLEKAKPADLNKDNECKRFVKKLYYYDGI